MGALQRVVEEQVQQNLGMAMMYAVVAAAQEWLRDKVTRHWLCCLFLSCGKAHLGLLMAQAISSLQHVHLGS